MKCNRFLLSAAIAALISGSLSFGTTQARAEDVYPFRNPDLPAGKRIDNILSLMTIDEKIDALGTNTAVPRLGIPSFGSSEGIHGVVQRGNEKRNWAAIPTTQFPQPPGMGETWDPDLIRQAAAVQGYEARYITQSEKYKRPILMQWGPQADLMRDPRWGRSEEVYGEDPFFNGTFVQAYVKGLQGDDPKYWQAASLMKHFLANSNENGRGSSSSEFDERLFREYYSVPFRMGFEAGGKGVMASYNAWNGTPMGVHPLLNGLIIDKWGAEVVSSDGGAVKNLVQLYKRYPTQEAAVVACLKAGINQFLDTYKDELHAALKDGSATEADIDTVLRRKFAVTLRLGLLDPPERVPYASIGSGPEPWLGEHDRAVSLKVALESITLLKNDGILPLDPGKLKRPIALIGPLAKGVHWDWYGGYPDMPIDLYTYLMATMGPEGSPIYAADNTNGAAVKAAKEADVAIVVVGNDPTCGPNMAHDWTADGTKPCADPGDGREGRDRETLSLAQEDLIKAVYAANPRTIVVLVSSFPYTINWTQDHVPAILHMTHSSQDEGTALGQVIFGDYNPGGHLTETWPASMDQLPPMMDYDIRHGRTYMYAKGQPLYPFGFGLSYTTFRYSNLKAPKTLARDGSVTADVDVTNTGKVAGDAVVQLYVRHLKSKVERPQKALAGFQRVNVEPGKTKTVHITLKASQLAYWNVAKQAFTVEAEPVSLMAGDSSANTPLSTTVVVR